MARRRLPRPVGISSDAQAASIRQDYFRPRILARPRRGAYDRDMSPGQRLRELAKDSTIQVPGAPSALLARLIERCGYEAMYLSGAAFSTGVLGLPDIGLFTLTELAQQTTYLTRACGLPLIVDADTGFGEAL